jgi:hypothetical protein
MAISNFFSNTHFAETAHIAGGRVKDAEVRNIFGYQQAGDTTLRAAWEFASTDYVFPTTAQAMTVTSADAADDGKLMLIKGLDDEYNEITETVTLTGAGDVITTNLFYRINDIIMLTGVTNVGLITVQNAAKTIKYGGIRANDGRNQASIFTVPAGKSFYLYRIDAFSSDTTAGKPAIFKNFTQTKTGQQYDTARTSFLGNMNIMRRLPFKYSQCTDIQFQLATFQGSHELSVFGEGVLLTERGTNL